MGGLLGAEGFEEKRRLNLNRSESDSETRDGLGGVGLLEDWNSLGVEGVGGA